MSSSYLVPDDVGARTAEALDPPSLRRVDLPSSPSLAGTCPDRASGAVVRSAVDRGLFAGAATGILGPDGSERIEAFGHADREVGRPVEIDSIFWIASLTKAMTSTLAMMLVEEGRLELDRPLAAYLPEFGGTRRRGWLSAFRRDRPLTIADLLRHTSGLPADIESGGRTLDRMTLAEKTRLAGAAGRAAPPGSAYRYSNWNHEVLGRAIEVAAVVPFADCLRERLLEPLGLRETSFRLTRERLERLALPYGRSGSGELERRPFVLIDEPFDDPRREPTPSFGLFSTVGDCLRFCAAHLNRGEVGGRRLWSNETADLTMRSFEHPLAASSQGLVFSLHAGTASIAGAFGGLVALYSLHRAAMVFLTASADFDEECHESRRAFRLSVADEMRSRTRADRREAAVLRAQRLRIEGRRVRRPSAAASEG